MTDATLAAVHGVQSRSSAMNRSLAQLQEALALLPADETLCLAEALQKTPALVASESDPSRFIRQANGNPMEAAQRLCRYWQERSRVYRERAFLPLDWHTNDREKASQQSGTICLLPSDSRGASVLYYECNSTSTGPNTTTTTASGGAVPNADARARLIFFWLQKLSENALSATAGCVVVVRCHLLSYSPLEVSAGTNTTLHWLARIFPIKIDALHVVGVTPTTTTMASTQCLSAVVTLWEGALRRQAVVHIGAEEDVVLRSLRRHGLRLERLPRGEAHPHILSLSMNLSASALSPNRTSVDPLQRRSNTPLQSPTGDYALSLQDDFAMRQQGLVQLQEAISFMPDHAKAAYLEAQTVCPDLVLLESNPLKFLIFARYNHWSAARRLTTYWSKRKEIFQRRAFLPMTQTGEGALNQDDIIFVRTGYFCFLPKDNSGRTVICYDPSRRTRHAKETRMRVGFYYWTLVCENALSATEGYVGLVLLGNGGFSVGSLDGAIRECVDIVVDCFPASAKNIHLVQSIRPTNARRSLLQMFLPIILNLMGRILENTGVAHTSDYPDEMLREFEDYGLTAPGLPGSAGGTWTYDLYYTWQMERCRLERQRYQLDSNVTEDNASTTTTASVGSSFSPTAEAVPSAALSSDSLAGNFPSSFLWNSAVPSDAVQVDYWVRRLSHSDKEAYVQACQQVPSLVQKESRSSWFVGTCENAREAARLLAAYWTLRKKLFGVRAFRPMTQTGEGALDRKDLTLLASGFFSVLPTKKTKVVLLSYDCSKDEGGDEGSRLRVGFYLLQLAAERDSSRSQGFYMIASGLHAMSKIPDQQQTFSILFDVFPVRVAGLHIIMLLPPGMPSFPLDDSVQAMRRQFGGSVGRKGLCHVGESKHEIAELLAPYDIIQRLLPKVLGGSFGYDRFTQWQELRLRYEWGLPAGANDREALEIYDFAKILPLTALSEEERKERKRRMNVVHSRRKRQREAIEIEVLQEQCDDLRDQHVVYTAQSEHLAGLMSQANALLAADNMTAG